MQKHPIATIVNFCSNDARFIGACIEQASVFSSQIIVVLCDHFFDGTLENRTLLEEIYRAYPQCLFIEYPFIPSEIPRMMFNQITSAQFWHSCSRLLALQYLEASIEMVLFLDADEVPDGWRFFRWLNASDYRQHVVLKMANYWYFREPIYQAQSWEDTVVLAQVRALSPELLLQQDDRKAIYDLLPGPKRRNVCSSDGQPMFHHFSWVRTRDEMVKKVRTWGLKNDRDWISLITQELAHTFQGTDFIHHYKYNIVPPPFLIDLELPPIFFPRCKDGYVIRISQREFLDKLQFKENILPHWMSNLIKLLDFKTPFRR